MVSTRSLAEIERASILLCWPSHTAKALGARSASTRSDATSSVRHASGSAAGGGSDRGLCLFVLSTQQTGRAALGCSSRAGVCAVGGGARRAVLAGVEEGDPRNGVRERVEG